ncbi:MAG: diguanylate cyclase [Shinella sp.]|nr:MAG: diguanylate cyclase [Shinella sp.]
MRIHEITNWAYGLTLVFTGVSAAAFIVSSHSADLERVAVEHHLSLDSLAEELALGADERTNDARLYVMSGEERRLVSFATDEAEEKRLEGTITAIRSLDPSQQEIDLLNSIRRDADVLDTIERKAIQTYQQGDVQKARDTLFGTEHVQIHSRFMANVETFRKDTANRTLSAVHDAQFRADFFGLIARILLGATAALFLGVLYFVLRRRVAMPLVKMAAVVRRLARQDYEVEVLQDSRHDEISEMNNALAVFRENGLERERLDAARRAEQQTKDLILQMMHRLQACQTRGEVAEMLTRFMPQIFPRLAGHLLLLNDRRTTLRVDASWLEPKRCEDQFELSDCWALRRGHPHVSDAHGGDAQCKHLREGEQETLCVPLSALGDTIGLLYFEEVDGAGSSADISRLYLELIAENVALAIANLELRERLTDMAIRDPLTGLLNRRSLDEMLNRFADGQGAGLACMMLDIDHFKRFNDEFGHDAGDMVMQHVAQIVRESVSDRGKVFRFGGEEFTVLCPGMEMEQALDLAEGIRAAVADAPLSHRARPLGRITMSIGVAQSPAEGPWSTLVSRADASLLRAKEEGRNRVRPGREQTVDLAPLAHR